jgi:hypothetical protein
VKFVLVRTEEGIPENSFVKIFLLLRGAGDCLTWDLSEKSSVSAEGASGSAA